MVKVIVEGTKRMYTYSRGERGEIAPGSEWEPIRNVRHCRDGTEELTTASKGDRCGYESRHQLEAGQEVYLFARKLFCRKHYFRIPTLLDVQYEFSDRQIYEITITPLS